MSVFKYVRQQKPKVVPELAIGLNSKFVYSGGADVLATWKKAGFIPPSEYREDFLFGVNRKTKEGL